jgi:hypothetical protein
MLLGMAKSSLRYQCYPKTAPPPEYAASIADVFRAHEDEISTYELEKGLTSDAVLAVIRDRLLALGFDVEGGKHKREKILRPVFFGENGEPALQYEVDAFHPEWKCGLEVEAGRAWKGNAIYRDLIQGMVMSEVDTLVIAVSNTYKYNSSGRQTSSPDFDNAVRVADSLYGHSRFKMPYRLMIVGY